MFEEKDFKSNKAFVKSYRMLRKITKKLLIHMKRGCLHRIIKWSVLFWMHHFYILRGKVLIKQISVYSMVLYIMNKVIYSDERCLVFLILIPDSSKRSQCQYEGVDTTLRWAIWWSEQWRWWKQWREKRKPWAGGEVRSCESQKCFACFTALCSSICRVWVHMFSLQNDRYLVLAAQLYDAKEMAAQSKTKKDKAGQRTAQDRIRVIQQGLHTSSLLLIICNHIGLFLYFIVCYLHLLLSLSIYYKINYMDKSFGTPPSNEQIWLLW